MQNKDLFLLKYSQRLAKRLLSISESCLQNNEIFIANLKMKYFYCDVVAASGTPNPYRLSSLSIASASTRKKIWILLSKIKSYLLIWVSRFSVRVLGQFRPSWKYRCSCCRGRYNWPKLASICTEGSFWVRKRWKFQHCRARYDGFTISMNHYTIRIRLATSILTHYRQCW